MLSSVSGSHFPGQWNSGIVPPQPPFPYAIDSALIYLNVPASNSTDLTTKFVNRGSATPLETSNLSGINRFVGPPAYAVNVFGTADLPPNTAPSAPPLYRVDGTNLTSLVPTIGVYTSITFWMRAPSIPQGTIIYLPSLMDGRSNGSSGISVTLKPDLTATGKGWLDVQHRSATNGAGFSGAYSTFLPGVWRHMVFTYTFGGGASSIFINGVLYGTWASPVGTLSTNPHYFTASFGQTTFSNPSPAHWNDLRVEANKSYTAAQALTAFNARRAYYGV